MKAGTTNFNSWIGRLSLGVIIAAVGVVTTPTVSASPAVDWGNPQLRIVLDAQRFSLSETDFDLPVMGITAGVPVYEGVVLELTAGRDLSGDTLEDLELRLTRFVELSMRMIAPPTVSGYRLMSRLGGTFATLEQRAGSSGALDKEDFSGLHFSLGFERAVSAQLSFSFEAVIADLDAEVDNAGIRFGFSWGRLP